jgi:hypothetical protein
MALRDIPTARYVARSFSMETRAHVAVPRQSRLKHVYDVDPPSLPLDGAISGKQAAPPARYRVYR